MVSIAILFLSYISYGSSGSFIYWHVAEDLEGVVYLLVCFLEKLKSKAQIFVLPYIQISLSVQKFRHATGKALLSASRVQIHEVSGKKGKPFPNKVSKPTSWTCPADSSWQSLEEKSVL